MKHNKARTVCLPPCCVSFTFPRLKSAMPAQLTKAPHRNLLTPLSRHYLAVKNTSNALQKENRPAASLLPDAPLPGPVGQDPLIEPQVWLRFTHEMCSLMPSSKGATETILQRHTAITVKQSDMHLGIKCRAVPVIHAASGVSNCPSMPNSSASFVLDPTTIPLHCNKGPEHNDDWIDILDDVPGGAQIDPEDVHPRKRTKAYFWHVQLTDDVPGDARVDPEDVLHVRPRKHTAVQQKLSFEWSGFD